MLNKDFLLSITIPTYNRAKFLDDSLSSLYEQLSEGNLPVEVIISDNCSTDNTEEVVNKYIKKGFDINYIKNSSNLGMDGNFTQCFRLASGKYVWLLGDDDYLKEGSLSKIVEILRDEVYGLIHIQTNSTRNEFMTVFDHHDSYLSSISYWITFISGNIVNSKYIKEIEFEKYFGTYFIQVPLYITAAIGENKNLIIHEKLFLEGIDASNNGGYNIFDVFINKYLSIWKKFVYSKKISRFFYEKEKFRLYRNFLIGYIYQFLIKREKTNFKTDHAWQIILNNYGVYPYFYLEFPIFLLKKLKERVIK
ncbi:MAG: glycosyltransferase family 2 protein [Dysgonomonas sp.]|nr:glycosyltransferase family 2 protein [Dysgonomonas sp.]